MNASNTARAATVTGVVGGYAGIRQDLQALLIALRSLWEQGGDFVRVEFLGDPLQLQVGRLNALGRPYANHSKTLGDPVDSYQYAFPRADFIVLADERDRQDRAVLPPTLGVCIAAAKPLLVLAEPDHALDHVMRRSRGALVVDGRKPGDIVEALGYLATDAGLRAALADGAARFAEHDAGIYLQSPPRYSVGRYLP